MKTAMIALGVVLAFIFYPDFGSTHDEELQAGYGQAILDWYGSGFTNKEALSYGGNTYLYGGFFEILTESSAKLFGGEHYSTRHAVGGILTALSGGAVAATASLISGPWAGLIAGVLYLANPLIVGHGFNNPKDAPFAALMCFGVWALVFAFKRLPEPGWFWVLGYGIAAGAASGTRVGGVLLHVYAFLGLLCVGIMGRKFPLNRRGVIQAISAVLLSWGVMLLSWPWALTSPLLNPHRAFRGMSRFDTSIPVFYDGIWTDSLHLPKSALPHLMLITLPDFIWAAVGSGLFVVLIYLYKNKKLPPLSFSKNTTLVVVIAAALPLVLAWARHSAFYHGTRHFLFVQAPITVLAAVVLSEAIRWQRDWGRWAQSAVVLLMVFALTVTVSDLVRLHPYQAIYFNRSFGGGVSQAGLKYDTEVWGATYREGVQWLAQQGVGTAQAPVKVANCSTAFLTSSVITELGASQLSNTSPNADPDYLLGMPHARCHLQRGVVVYEVERMGIPLMQIVKVH